MKSYSQSLEKALGLPLEVDPTHQYIFKSGEYGPLYQYWWKDSHGNYWLYTNAPEGAPDHEEALGQPLIVGDQPMSHTAPAFFSEEGRKRHVAVPQDIQTQPNPNYNGQDPQNVWYEMYTTPDGAVRYVYLDTDVKENLDLYVQNQTRVADAQLMGLRNMAVELFNKQHPKDKIAGAILMLIDQAFFVPENLSVARVSDLEFIDNTVKLFGRKFVCDPAMFDFLTSIHVGRQPEEPLFAADTYHGKMPLGIYYIYSLFRLLKVSPKFLHQLQANKVYARVMNRLAYENLPYEQANERALLELARVLGTNDNVLHFVDLTIKRHVKEVYDQEQQQDQEQDIEKSLLTFEDADDYAVPYVSSKLVELTPAEQEFSVWLHSQPLHELSPEQQMMEQQIQQQAQEQPEEGEEEDDEKQENKGAEKKPENEDEGVPEKEQDIHEGKGAEPIKGGGASGL